MKSEIITKLDAAQRQLDTSFRLWFLEEDVVSVFTLAASAHQIIHDLNQRLRGEDLLFDSLIIKEEFRNQYVAHLKRPWNFLKHADNDPDGVLKIDENSVHDFFLFSAKGLKQLGQNTSGITLVFLLWFGIHFPKYLRSKEKFLADFGIDESMEDSLKGLSKPAFLHYCTSRLSLISPDKQ
ncbi:hypothetical protein [Prosthecobacter algae]|uniref:hypothetical protein n=1 Tax=Prosthecobacter algae TaxID=1144682 RepID=UPI0031E6C37C